jgi:hypothetical protein
MRGAWNATVVRPVAEPSASARTVVIAPWPVAAGSRTPLAATGALLRRTARRTSLSRKASFTASGAGVTIAGGTLTIAGPEATARTISWRATSAGADSAGFTVATCWTPRITRRSSAPLAAAWCGPVVDVSANASSPERDPVHLFDHRVRVTGGNLGHRVAVANLELPDTVARDPRLSGDRADEIAWLHAITLTDAEEDS